MTEQTTAATAAVEPIAWFARRSTIAVASIAVVALVAGIIVGVSASQARAADTAARELIIASVSDAKAARTSCTAAVSSSTAEANTAAYVTTISDALGADSEAAKTAVMSHDKPYLIADCAIAGKITELSADEDPSDNVDAITVANTAAIAAWVALATDIKALDTKVSADLAALTGLAEANTAYTTALTSLQDKLTAAQALTEGELAVYLSEQQVATLNNARDTAQQVLDVAVGSLDAILPMSLNNRATTLDEALAVLTAVVDPINTTATDAKTAAEAQAAAEAAAAAAKARRSSGSTSSSSGSTSGGSTGTAGALFCPAGATCVGGNISFPYTGTRTLIGWSVGFCGDNDFTIWNYWLSAGWTESSAKADAEAKGCTSFSPIMARDN